MRWIHRGGRVGVIWTGGESDVPASRSASDGVALLRDVCRNINTNGGVITCTVEGRTAVLSGPLLDSEELREAGCDTVRSATTSSAMANMRALGVSVKIRGRNGGTTQC